VYDVPELDVSSFSKALGLVRLLPCEFSCQDLSFNY
jgi:hypothetical protein